MTTISRRNLCFCAAARGRARALLASSCVLALWALGATAARAQERQEKPFVEPSESHEKAKVRPQIEAQPQLNGRWDTLPVTMPINPVHVALMHNGKVLIVSGSGNDPDNHNLQAAVWDPKTDTIKTFLARRSTRRAGWLREWPQGRNGSIRSHGCPRRSLQGSSRTEPRGSCAM